MKIVHVLTRLLRAGSEENTLATCRAQIADGHDVYLFHGHEFDERYYQSPVPGLSLVRVASLVHPLAPVADVIACHEMTRRFRELCPDVVHTHQSKAGIIGRFAARLAGVPLIIHGVHIVPFANVGCMQRLVYLCAEKAAALVTHAFVDVSQGMRDIYLAAGVGRPEDHHVVHSGFDLGRFKGAQPPDDWRELLGLEANAPRPHIIVMLAALEPRKRHCEFLDEFGAVVARFPEVRLIMPGEGPYRSVVEARIRELGLERNARLVGYRTDPERLIALADVCVLTSTREGLPRVIMQYLAVGRTCVACDLPGLDEVLCHDVNAVVVPPTGLRYAALALADLLADPDRLARLTAGARATDLESWDVRSMGARMSDIYSAYRVTG